MKENEFPDPKVSEPEKTGDSHIDDKVKECFDYLNNYRDSIKPFIYNNIQLIYPSNDEKVNLSRIQQLMSSVLLRSLYIRNGIVDAINSKNLVSVFSNLKSFLEVPAFLAYLLSVIEKDALQEQTLETLVKLSMGNKGEGELRVGTQEAVNILTMFEKLENYIREMRKISTDNKDKEEIDTVMSEFYGLVCNASHPNYDAHDLTSDFDTEKEIWLARSPKDVESKIINDIAWYAPPLIMTIVMTKALSTSISSHAKINNFKTLTSSRLFD